MDIVIKYFIPFLIFITLLGPSIAISYFEKKEKNNKKKK